MTAQTHRLAVGPAQPGAAALLGHHPVVAHRVVDDAGDGLALDHDRGHHRKQRQPRGEIAGSIDGIDGYRDFSGGELVEQRRIGGHRFLADHERTRPAPLDFALDEPFRLGVGLGHEVGGIRLGLDGFRIEPPEARQDLGSGRIAEQVGEF